MLKCSPLSIKLNTYTDSGKGGPGGWVGVSRGVIMGACKGSITGKARGGARWGL